LGIDVTCPDKYSVDFLSLSPIFFVFVYLFIPFSTFTRFFVQQLKNYFYQDPSQNIMLLLLLMVVQVHSLPSSKMP